MAGIALTSLGEGQEILLVHGGAGPATTWRALRPLGARWRLLMLHRRGSPPSPPPPGGRVDFDVDAGDVAGVLDRPMHVVGHSYGGVGAAMAAIARPDLVLSLTLIEPALYPEPGRDAEVDRLRALGETVLRLGVDCEPARAREFFEIAGGPPPGEGGLSDVELRVLRRIQGTRPPSEACPALHELREAGTPVLVASGDHTQALERMCDLVAEATGGLRLHAPGAGHFVQDAPGFVAGFEAFMRTVLSGGGRGRTRAAGPSGTGA